MSTEGIFASLVLFAVSAVWILLPLRRMKTDRAAQVARQKQYDELLTEYERVLLVIRDLDEDYNTGKLSPEVYENERAIWAERGVTVLQAIETMSGVRTEKDTKKKPPTATAENADQVLDDAIEQAIASYVKAKTAKN